MMRRIAAVAAAGLTAATFGLSCASVATAAPTPTPERGAPIVIRQVPNLGITVSSSGVTGGFSAILGARTAPAARTDVAFFTSPRSACTTNLHHARVAITWNNESTHRSGSKVFPACDHATLDTGHGQISFTTTVLGRGDRTFTVIPGTGRFQR